jgi:hypothetical protein
MRISTPTTITFCVCCLLLTLTLCHAYSSEYDVDSEDLVRQPFQSYDRRGGNWCARWGDYCVPNSRVKFANCCNDLRCVCGTLLWKPGQCQCRKPSMFGWPRLHAEAWRHAFMRARFPLWISCSNGFVASRDLSGLFIIVVNICVKLKNLIFGN